MASIKSGNSSAVLNVDPYGQARVIFYDVNGNPISDTHPLPVVLSDGITMVGDLTIINNASNPVPISDGGSSITVDGTVSAQQSGVWVLGRTYTGSYVLPINISPATLTDDTVYWAMRNTGLKSCYIKKITVNLGFYGTAAPSKSFFSFERFNSATPAGGTVLSVIRNLSSYAASSVGDIRHSSSGLSVAGVNFETPFCVVGTQNQLSVSQHFEFSFSEGNEESRLILSPGEGICIKADEEVLTGSFMVGMICWDER